MNPVPSPNDLSRSRRRSFTTVAISLSTSLLFLACFSGVGVVTAQSPGPDQLIGTVLDAKGVPAAQMNVWVIGDNYKTQKVLAKTKTDAEGRFLVELAGETDAKWQRYSVFTRSDNSIGWKSNAQREPSEIRIELSEVATFRAKIVDKMNRPIVDARAHLSYLNTPETAKQQSSPIRIPPELGNLIAGTSRQDGSMELAGLPKAGKLRFEIQSDQFGAHEILCDLDKRPTITIDGTGSLQGKVIAENRPITCSGVVYYSRNSPNGDDAKTSEFTIIHYGQKQLESAQEFSIDSLPVGKYSISFQLDQVFADTSSFEVEIKKGETASLNIPVRKKSKVSGQVVDTISGKPVPNVELRVRTIKEQRIVSASRTSTLEDGSFVGFAQPGTVDVIPAKVPEKYLTNIPSGDRPSVEATEGEEVQFPEIRLERSTTVSGTVVDESGTPVPNAEIYLVLPDRPDVRNSTAPIVANDKGEFTLRQMDPIDTLPIRAIKDNLVSKGATVIVPKDQKESLRLEVAKSNGFAIQGRVANRNNNPIAGAKVQLSWDREYVSQRYSMASVGSFFQTLQTDENGSFATRALWPGDRYSVTISADGFERYQSKYFEGESDVVQNLGDIKLTSVSNVVAGRVVDTNNKPVEGVHVFCSENNPSAIASKSDVDGKFELSGLRDGIVYVFAEREGYRFTGIRVESNSTNATIRLLSVTESPRKLPPGNQQFSYEAQRQVAKRMLDAVWDLPEHQRKSADRILIETLARLDSNQAIIRAAPLGKTRLANKTIAEQILSQNELAAESVDEAVFLLQDQNPLYAVGTMLRPVERLVESQLLKDNREQALTLVNSGLEVARKAQEPRRSYYLARVAANLARCGEDKKAAEVFEQAIASIEKHDPRNEQSFARGMVAKWLAEVDPDRALSMIENTDEESKDRYLGLVAVAMAASDPDRALKLVDKLSKDSTSANNVKMKIAYHLALKDPKKGIAIAEQINDGHGRVKVKADAFGWLARAIAPQDQQLANSLIDRTLSIYREQPEVFRSWSNYGGRGLLAARLTAHADAIGYPDMHSVMHQALACRPIGEDAWTEISRQKQTVQMAMVVATVNPSTARDLLQSIDVRDELLGGGGYDTIDRTEWYRAWALADPIHAEEIFTSALKERADNFDLFKSSLYVIPEVLSIPPKERVQHILKRNYASWFPGEE